MKVDDAEVAAGADNSKCAGSQKPASEAGSKKSNRPQTAAVLPSQRSGSRKSMIEEAVKSRDAHLAKNAGAFWGLPPKPATAS